MQRTNLKILLIFTESSTSLFDTIVVKKLTAVSKSGLELFIINKNFSTTKWKNYTFFSHSCLESSLTPNNFLVAGDLIDVVTSSPKNSMHSSNCSTLSICMVLYFISIFIPKKVCLLPLTTYSSTNVSSLHL